MLGRSVTFNMLGGVGSLAVGFGSSILLARSLGASDRGLLGVMVTAGSVGLSLSGLGLPMATMYYSSRKDVRGNHLLGNTAAYGAMLAALFIPLAWIFHAQLADLFARGHGGRVWVLAAGLVPLTFLDWTTHNQLLGKLRFGFYNVLVIASKVATLVCVVVLVVVAGLGVTGGVIATMAASLVMIGGSLPVILRDGKAALDLALFRRMVGYGVRVQIGSILEYMNYRLDVLLLGIFRPLSQVGYYFVASFLAELVVTVANAFQSSVLPLISHYEGDARQADTTTAAVRHHGILAILAMVANAAFAPLVIVFLYGSGFVSAILPFFILLPGMWFLGTATVVQGNLRGRGRPGLASKLAAIAVGVTVALDLLLIPPFGPTGAALASLGAYVCFGTASLLALSRVTGIAIRRLAVPTADDLRAYPTAIRGAIAGLRVGKPG